MEYTVESAPLDRPASHLPTCQSAASVAWHIGRRGKSGRPRGDASASAGTPKRPHLPGDPEEEDEEEKEEEEAEPDLEEFRI